MRNTLVAVAVITALISGGALAQATAPAAAPKAAPKAAAAATPAAGDKQLYTQGQYDVLLKERLAQGGQDTPEVRNAVKEELNTRELLAREAKKAGLQNTPDVKTQMDLAAQTVLVRAYVSDWVKKNPVPEADLKKEYDTIKSQIGDKEYKVRHILVEKEDDAKAIITELQKGAKFDELAKARSKDPGSKDKGGDLDWNAPANFVKPFGDAMKATPKG
jgi:peptidyl-prolyl cis-trans isomerase C